LPLLAADVIGDGGDCNSRFLAKEAAAVVTAAREIFLRDDVQNITFSKSNILNINLDPPIFVKDRQLAVLKGADKRAAPGAGNSGKSRGSARADNNQPKSGSKDDQNITLNVIF
jgi:hypothetical protein